MLLLLFNQPFAIDQQASEETLCHYNWEESVTRPGDFVVVM